MDCELRERCRKTIPDESRRVVEFGIGSGSGLGSGRGNETRGYRL